MLWTADERTGEMTMEPHPLASARAVAALLGLAALTSCSSCSETETNKARDTVAEVLDRLDRLDSLCADDVQVTALDNGRQLKFTPVLRNGREATTGGLRLKMKVSASNGQEYLTPAPYVQLPATTSYPPGPSAVADPRASLTVAAQPNAAYIVTTEIWAPLYPAPAPENGTRPCHSRQTEYHNGQ
jgi:hypothetical protein